MARRLTLEGAEVVCVCELMPYSNGLNRNIVQCLDDYGIPLKLSTTVVGIEGRDRVKGVWIAPVDPKTLKPEYDKKEFIECDTLLLSIGLIPETELAVNAGAALGANRGLYVDEKRQTKIHGVFACGNVVQVHDVVDYVAKEGEIAGQSAAEFVKNGQRAGAYAEIRAGSGISYVVPGRISLPAKSATLDFRVKNVFKNAQLVCSAGGRELVRKKRPVMVPGEMERLTVNLEGVSEDCGIIEIEVEDA
jgi:NADPH-dependent 2,4-dienoyl-CoA reductase/sulfur reductase-like enzyme